MRTSSGRENRAGVPLLVFAAGSLKKGGGGIAELSRQVFATLLEMRRDNQLDLELHVLDDPGPALGDELFQLQNPPAMRWYAGNRLKFSTGLLRLRPRVFLFDHVGLARLQGLIPGSLARPYLLLIHSVEIWNNHRSDYHRTARRAALLIANSEYTARKARLHYPDLPEIVVCWPGKDQAENECSTQDASYENLGSHAMLIVGRLDSEQRHKGHDALISAMPLILQSVPDAQLVVAGGGDDRTRLEQKARELGVANQVLFLGRVDEFILNELYKRCALFVMPSDGDGFGMVFLEAMAHQMPCVGLAQGAAAEIFENGKSGILVDRSDLVGLANCLARCLLDEELRKRIGVAGCDRYRSAFLAKHHAERLRSVLHVYLNN